MPKFLTVPAADGDDLTNAAIHTSETLTGLGNGTSYICYELSEPSAPFTPTGLTWWHPGADTGGAHIDFANDRARIFGVSYASIAAAVSAGVGFTLSGGVYRLAVSPGSEWTMAAKGICAAVTPSTAQYLLTAQTTSNSQLVGLCRTTSGGNSHSVLVFAGGSNQVSMVSPKANGTAITSAIRVKLNDVAHSLDGAAVSTDTNAGFPSTSQLIIGNRHDGTRPWNGTIDEVLFVDAAISNADLPGVLA